MHVKEEGTIDVPAAHFAEVSLVPAHPCRLPDTVESGHQRCHDQEGEAQPPTVTVFAGAAAPVNVFVVMRRSQPRGPCKMHEHGYFPRSTASNK